MYIKSEMYCCTWFCFFDVMLNLYFAEDFAVELSALDQCLFYVSQGTTQCCDDITNACNLDIVSLLAHCLNSTIGPFKLSMRFNYAYWIALKLSMYLCKVTCKAKYLFTFVAFLTTNMMDIADTHPVILYKYTEHHFISCSPNFHMYM